MKINLPVLGLAWYTVLTVANKNEILAQLMDLVVTEEEIEFNLDQENLDWKSELTLAQNAVSRRTEPVAYDDDCDLEYIGYISAPWEIAR